MSGNLRHCFVESVQLEEQFRGDDGRKVKRSYIWNKYSRGEAVPRVGYWEDGPEYARARQTQLPQDVKVAAVDVVAARRLRTAGDVGNSGRLFGASWANAATVHCAGDASNRPILEEHQEDQRSVFHLASHEDINAATAILAMVKEEEIVQSPEAHKYAVKATADLMGDV